ncbi:MAG TPA: response regulator [Bacteroidales bacterium]|nr:response regulator [Bacteroidales bacterium]
MLRKMKIGRRLVFGYAVILAFSLATSIIAILEINNIWRDTKSLYEHPYAASNLIKDIKINSLNIRRYMLDVVFLADNPEREKIIIDIDREEELAFSNFKKIQELYSNEAIGIEEPYIYFRDWRPLRDAVIQKVRSGNIAESSELIVTRNKQYVDELFQKMEVVIDNVSKIADEFYANASKTKQQILISLMIILIAALSASIVLAYYITRSIAVPLSVIVGNIREIAKGNLNNKKLPVEDDEIGELAESFNIMQDDLFEKGLTAQRISQGDFSAKVVPSSENDMVAESINMIASNFKQVVSQAEKVADGDFRSEISGISGANTLTIVIMRMLSSLREVVDKARKIAQGDFTGEILPKSESDELAIALNRMTAALRTATEQNLQQSRLKTAQNELNEQMRGDLDPDQLARNIITHVSKYTKAQIGAIFLHDEERKGFQLMGSYAYKFRKGVNIFFKEGEGLIGQAALEKEIINFSELPDDYIRITSGIGDAVPRNVIIAPFVYENRTLGVIELGSVTEFSEEAFEFIRLVVENIAISIMSSVNRMQMARLLEVTKAQAEELQVQQEELRQTNEELETQASALKKSEESLQAQQEELRVINEELEEKTNRLEEHKDSIERQNKNLEKARSDIEKKARELEITNRYKSEFLANMSHELRTPLNSLLLLAQSLTENKTGNLTNQQIQAASIIYNSGNDLLKLINDILDLSKIESGKMQLALTLVPVSGIESSIRDYFSHVITEKGLELKIDIREGVPENLYTDEQRLNQILRNLLSNAVKFTEKGGIYVSVYKPEDEIAVEGRDLVAISIKDTGIGIHADQQEQIFEAFHQVDGSISRRYSGSGLGLSITRELTRLLQGKITLKSEPGKGSEFIITIPARADEYYQPQTKTEVPEPAISKGYSQPLSRESKTEEKKQVIIPDDRDSLKEDDPLILIIEDDIKFAVLLQNICHDKGFKCLVTVSGEEGIELSAKYRPKGIILDLKLPGMTGWEVLDELKLSAETRHIPVHIMSGYEETLEAYNKGAIGYLMKPVTKEKIETAIDQMQSYMSGNIRNLLIIEDDSNLRKSIRVLLDARDINITESTTAEDAISQISEKHFDCIVLDLGLPDVTGFEMLRELKNKNIKVPPVVVYTGKELTREENAELQHYTQNIIIKGVKSEERLLDETALFLHRVIKDMPEHQRKIMSNLYDKEEMFRGKKILIVDDDMRNVFAITSVLEAGHMNVISAADGKKALQILEKKPDFDLILMDIMMPEMDGYETVRRIRKSTKMRNIPIIMLTAKAMKEDRDKSLAAGANDYLSKPVDVGKLLNLMRIWLYQ